MNKLYLSCFGFNRKLYNHICLGQYSVTKKIKNSKRRKIHKNKIKDNFTIGCFWFICWNNQYICTILSTNYQSQSTSHSLRHKLHSAKVYY